MKIALITNILSPYRKIFYDKLYKKLKKENIEFKVFVMAEGESNRVWKYDEFKSEYTQLLKCRAKKFANIYFHINPNLKKCLLEFKPDILVASGSYTAPSVWKTIKLKKTMGYKLFFWSESHLEEARNYNKLKLFIRDVLRNRIYKKFDGFWYSGKKSLEFIKKYCSETCAFYFLPNLIDDTEFNKAISLRNKKSELRNEYNIPLENFVFIAPARLTAVKGLIPFLEIYIKSNNKNKTTILISGDGELKDSIQTFIDENNIDVRLMGYKVQEEMIKLYALADSFLMPSLSDPNPLSAIEAIWSGLPLLVSEHVGNYPEIVKVGENGYIFSYNNLEEALNLIDKIIEADKDWLDNAQKISLCKAKSIYYCDKAVENLVNLLKSCVTAKP